MTVHLRSLEVTHDGRPLVQVQGVRLEPGRPVTVVGESGSGKSLLAHAVMGTLAPDLHAHGQLDLDGTSYDLRERDSRRHLWGRQVALLPQEPALALDPTMRVGAQVAEGALRAGRDRSAARAEAGALLEGLGIGGIERAYPHALSGGMAQRVAFAAATVGRASMLIADEPSKGLDDRALADLADLLRRHVHGGGYLLTITHDLDLARGLGGDVLVMKEAAIIERGPAERVLTEPAHEYTRRLLAAEPRHWTHPWVRRPTDPPSGPDHESEVLVAADGLTKAFGERRLFHDLSLVLQQGERVALSGPSGSGKTTLGNILLRLMPPDAGTVRHAPGLGGGRLQKLYQDPALSFPQRSRLREAFGDLLRRHRIPAEDLERSMAAVRLPDALLSRRPGQVSGGELQRLAVVRAMLMRPALVFADEPTSRLDLLTQEETMRELITGVERHGTALLLVTHHRALATAIADRTLSVGSRDDG